MRFTTALVAIASIFATVSVAAPSPETVSQDLKCGVCDFTCRGYPYLDLFRRKTYDGPNYRSQVPVLQAVRCRLQL